MNLHGVLNKRQGRRLRVRRGAAMVAAVGVAMLGGIGVATTAQANGGEPPVYKDYVCKYVGTPGVDETLTTGDLGFVWVDSDSTQGTYFNDDQDDSYVLLTHVRKDPEPVSAGVVQGATCPAGRVPMVTVTSEHATSCTQYSVRDVTTTIGWVEVDGQWVQGEPVITYGEWVNSVPTAEQLEAAGLVCTILLIEVTPEASATLGNCDAAGHVTLGDNKGYSWSGNTGTAIAPIYTAVAKTGYTLTGTTSWTLDLSKIGKIAPQSVDAEGLCYVAPSPVVAGVVENAPAAKGVVKSAPVKTLAFTGAETVPLGLSGLLALVLGAVLTVASRRQRPKQARE